MGGADSRRTLRQQPSRRGGDDREQQRRVEGSAGVYRQRARAALWFAVLGIVVREHCQVCVIGARREDEPVAWGEGDARGP